MNSSSLVTLFFYLSIIFITPSLSKPFSPSNSINLYGSALLNNSSIYLTKHLENCTILQPSHGRAFYPDPISFLDTSTNSTASFSCMFSFTITNSVPCPFGDGLTFLITSFRVYDGYMGLPDDNTYDYSEVQDSYLAVEFDTAFDPILEDVNGNHIGIDVNKVSSVASVDTVSRGDVDLKDGKEKTAWIEYTDSEQMIRVWIGYSREVKPQNPVLALRFDLSKLFKKYMHVGFTASNGQGSSTHVIHYWKFNTLFNKLSRMKIPVDTADETPEESDIEFGTFQYHPSSNNRRILVLALLFAGSAILVILTASVIFAFVYHMKRKRLRRARSERQIRRFHGGRMVPKMLSLTEIKSATNGFNMDKIIGEGASAVDQITPGCESQMIPGLLDELGLECVLRCPIKARASCSNVSMGWNAVFSSQKSFFGLRKKLLVRDPWLFMFVNSRQRNKLQLKALNVKDFSWHALPFPPHLIRQRPYHIFGFSLPYEAVLLVLIGHRTDNETISNRLLRYDMCENGWYLVREFNSSSGNFRVVSVDRKLYITQGVKLRQDDPDDTIHVLDPEAGTLEPLQTAFTHSSDHRSFLFKEKLILTYHQGFTGKSFDPKSRTWENMPKDILPGAYMGSGGGRILTQGGPV